MSRFVVDLSTISAAAAGICYTVFALRQGVSGGLRSSTSKSSIWLVGALACSAAWGWTAAAEPHLDSVPTGAVNLLDLARYGCWFGFLLSIGAQATGQKRQGGLALLTPFATFLILFGLL